MLRREWGEAKWDARTFWRRALRLHACARYEMWKGRGGKKERRNGTPSWPRRRAAPVRETREGTEQCSIPAGNPRAGGFWQINCPGAALDARPFVRETPNTESDRLVGHAYATCSPLLAYRVLFLRGNRGRLARTEERHVPRVGTRTIMDS